MPIIITILVVTTLVYYFSSSVELHGPSKHPPVLSLTERWLRFGENCKYESNNLDIWVMVHNYSSIYFNLLTSCVSSTDGSMSSTELGVMGLGVVRIGLFIGHDITSPIMMFGLIFCNCCCSCSRAKCFFISCRSSFCCISCSNRRIL